MKWIILYFIALALVLLFFAGCKKLVNAGIISPSDSVVCILTGHLLKDPDYTVEFHKDELYADVCRESRVTGRNKIPTDGYRNAPVKMPADADAILDFITKK